MFYNLIFNDDCVKNPAHKIPENRILGPVQPGSSTPLALWGPPGGTKQISRLPGPAFTKMFMSSAELLGAPPLPL